MEITVKLTADESLLKVIYGLSDSILAASTIVNLKSDNVNANKVSESIENDFDGEISEYNENLAEQEATEDAQEDVQEEADEPKFTLEEVRAAFGNLAKKKGNQAAKALLAEYDVTKVTDLSKNAYNSVMAKIEELV